MTSAMDLRSSKLAPSVAGIIEANTGSSVKYKQLYTEITLTDGLPTRVYKYEDAEKTNLLWDIVITWDTGLPSSVVTTNVVGGSTTTTSFAGWVDGIPTQITKVES